MDNLMKLYHWFQTIKELYYTIDTVEHYMISNEGEQLPLYEATYKPIWGFLTVYNKNYNYKYKFSRNFEISDAIQPAYKWFGLQVTVNEKQYLLNVNEFLVVPNILFTDPIKLWICRKLRIEPTTNMIVSIINEDVKLVNLNTIELYADNYKYEQT